MNFLELRIENVTTLENGGPVAITVDERGVQVGRKQGMTWVLPDPSRHISGHHFDVTHHNGNFFLTDVSSNGTFLHGERYPLVSPHEIRDSDRFIIGHYLIRAQIVSSVPQPSAPPMQTHNTSQAAAVQPDVEAIPNAFPPTMATVPTKNDAPPLLPEFQPATIGPTSAEDQANDDVWPIPAYTEPAPDTKDVQLPPSFAGIKPTNTVGQLQQPGHMPLSTNLEKPLDPPSPAQESEDVWGKIAPGPMPTPERVEPVPPPPPPADVPAPFPLQQATPYPPQPAYPEEPVPQVPPSHDHGAEILQAFLNGAGISDSSRLQISPVELAYTLGICARAGTNELMQLLQDRAAVKLFVSNEDRTMRIADGNNPMKFLPDAEQAFEAMFLNPRPGYLSGGDSFRGALKDLRRHHTAVIAALQPALAATLDGLSPKDIEASTSKKTLGGNSKKMWAEFERRWEERAQKGENGMLDAFIEAFSQLYSEAVRKQSE